jgi:CRP-like cAMP-binding protein
MFEVFFSHIADKVTLDEDEQALVKSYFSPKKLRKKQYLLQEGDACKYLAFVELGLLRSYNVDDKEVEHMLQFAWEGWWISDTYSFLSGEPAAYNIDAIDDAELLLITLPHFEEMMLQVPKMERYFRILFQKNIISKERRLLSSISLPAEEKYKQLVDTNPELVQRIPQNLIASYLGVTPETLSRIRKNISHKK